MKKRITAFFLSFIMVMSMFAQYVPGVSAKEIDPWENPGAYIGSIATFNSMGGEESLSSFHIVENPESYDYDVCWPDDTYWLYNESGEEGRDELPVDDMKMVITDCYDHEVSIEEGAVRFVWYKVEAAEGYELPEKMTDKPYILYMTADDIEYGVPASLNFDLIEETEEATPVEMEETAEEAAEAAEELLGAVPAEKIDPWEDPEAYVGSTATFNTDELVDFHVFGNPESYDYNLCWEDNTYWIYNSETTDELPDDAMQMVITGYYDHEVLVAEDQTRRFVWYKVEAAEGYELPEKMADKPYVLYMTTDDYELAMPASLLFDLIDKPQEPEVPEEPENAGKPELGEGYTIEEVGLKGYFSEDVVKFYQQPVGTAITADLNTAELPDFIDVAWMVTDTRLSKPEVWYAVKVDENWSDIADWLICYVPISHVTLVPAEVTEFYEKLLGATTVDEYEELMENADAELMEQLTEKHFANLGNHYNDMVEAETRTEEGTVTIGEVSVPVTVTGLLPEGATVSVDVVDDAAVMDDGFDIESQDEIVLALDIKVLDKDGNEWQPKEGRQITVSIGMAELGYEDGKIFRLHHKHGEDIDVFEVFVVMDGKLTVTTNGFSLYVISDFNNFNQNNPSGSGGARIVDENTGTVTLNVGDTVVFYTDIGNETANNLTSVWWVTDPEGAIFYEVYSNRTPNSYGSNGRWLRVTALKQTKNPISLHFLYTDNININQWENPDNFNSKNMREQRFSLSIVPPQPTASDTDGYKLYIRDTVNTTGTITAVLVDENGNEVTSETLGGILTCSWARDDGALIIPGAYKNNGVSIDICRDHGGLLQERLKNVTYTVVAKLPDGREKTASYTVYYQSEILNASFENPATATATYTFLPNGYPNLFWKTTSPGTLGRLARDVEFARYVETGNTNFDINADFYPDRPDNGRQIAEINAENFGALYQDIITAPGEDLAWEFSHAERGTDRSGEAMFVILGPTEHAQTLTNYSDLRGLVREIVDDYKKVNGLTADDDVLAYLSGSTNGVRNSIRYTKASDPGKGSVYEIWYNNADALKKPANDAWTKIEGEYEVPANQYRTRLFFVSDPLNSNAEFNYGNLIDSSRGGQYKSYLIEYYEEEYITDESGTRLVRNLITHRKDNGEITDETGVALVYSSVQLQNYSYFEEVEHDLLASVDINGVNSPYNIKYLNYPCLFIESYPKKTISCLDKNVTDRTSAYYEQYDIVMQICFRDTMIAVQKWVEFPKLGTGENVTEALNATQKQMLINELIAENGHGYEARFDLQCNTDKHQFANQTITIARNDPSGWYTGYVPIGDNPKGSHTFTLQEEYASPLTGLTLEKVKFEYYQFENGFRKKPITVVYTDISTQEEIVDGVTTNKLVGVLESDETRTQTTVSQSGIILNDTGDNLQKLAEIKVTNYYQEKQITIKYEAVGKGSVALQDGTLDYVSGTEETFAYYSGKPQGAKVQPGKDYIFAGWYLDKECTKPVDKNHGYVEGDAFIPNKDRTITDNVLEVTYYAKFSIGSLQIIRENAEPGQVFVYKIEYKTKNDEGNEETHEMYVTVVADENGKGSTEIIDAPFGVEYTVTQLNDWSWRHKDTEYSYSIQKPHEMTEGLHGSMNMTTVFEFNDSPTEEYWLNGNSALVKNVHGGGN